MVTRIVSDPVAPWGSAAVRTTPTSPSASTSVVSVTARTEAVTDTCSPADRANPVQVSWEVGSSSVTKSSSSNCADSPALTNRSGSSTIGVALTTVTKIVSAASLRGDEAKSVTVPPSRDSVCGVIRSSRCSTSMTTSTGPSVCADQVTFSGSAPVTKLSRNSCSPVRPICSISGTSLRRGVAAWISIASGALALSPSGSSTVSVSSIVPAVDGAT